MTQPIRRSEFIDALRVNLQRRCALWAEDLGGTEFLRPVELTKVEKSAWRVLEQDLRQLEMNEQETSSYCARVYLYMLAVALCRKGAPGGAPMNCTESSSAKILAENLLPVCSGFDELPALVHTCRDRGSLAPNGPVLQTNPWQSEEFRHYALVHLGRASIGG